ncbi:hypothetical protein BACCOPRO_01604 [Phocaeicola coprophilus DSM 18228 = JCM 13818]|uniref:Uncharacterized protein n=1 Tax=Phocaeicola coprophilus DSM 18228 = JCM 13818 TaxID=547042 RepID=S0F8Q9_9BACT|nr:hypothetical protein BACCOPRO_01604 [Phocaeicola coprophilus DSM 18228 = JCM 13818]
MNPFLASIVLFYRSPVSVFFSVRLSCPLSHRFYRCKYGLPRLIPSF